jgi:SAM-dependent methyltransferase
VSGNIPKDYPLADYDAHARNVPVDAYWTQVRRTINGEPISEAQIAMIVGAITSGLSLKQNDRVIDLACGNGYLSSYLFDKCAGVVGVDVSPYLIEVAQKNFARPPNYSFCVNDMASYAARDSDAARFTKALIYASFQYLSKDDAASVLESLKNRFTSVSKVFVGNVPNKDEAARFYRERAPSVAELSDHEARIGTWYSPDEFRFLSGATGWRATLSTMPAEFYAAAYRFDATLERFDR